MEIERYYKTIESASGVPEITKEIDPTRGYIVLYFFNDGHQNHYNFYGMEIEDPYMNERKDWNKLHLSLTGSDWVIKQCIPFMFQSDPEVIEKLKESLMKQNTIMQDFSRGE